MSRNRELPQGRAPGPPLILNQSHVKNHLFLPVISGEFQ